MTDAATRQTGEGRYSWLPEVLAEIAGVCGLDSALALARARGGTRVYIPASADRDHWLVRAVGQPAADAICRHYRIRDGNCGCWVMLPLGPRGALVEIRAMVDRMIAEGRPSSEIAMASGYSLRGVERRRARFRTAETSAGRKKQPSAQRELF